MVKKDEIQITGYLKILDNNDIIDFIEEVEFEGNNEDEIFEEIKKYLIEKLSECTDLEIEEIEENAIYLKGTEYFALICDKYICEYYFERIEE